MKKWSRIGICLVLTVCLLLLPACKGGQTPPTDDPQQSAGSALQNQENTGSSQVQDVAQNPEQNNGSTGLPFTWTVHTLETTYFNAVGKRLLESTASKDAYDGLLGENKSIFRLNHMIWQDWTEYIGSRHTECVAAGYCLKKTTNDGKPCDQAAFFRNETYPETFFQQNTLLVLDILNNQDVKNSNPYIPFAFKELRYADHVLTAVVERQYTQASTYKVSWCIFIEINTVLPADTELKLEIEEYNDPRLNDLPKTVDFNWKETHTQAKLFFNDAIGAKYKESIYGYHYYDRADKFTIYAGMLLSHDSYTQLKADAQQQNIPAFDSHTYTEEFFESNSLVLVNATLPPGRFPELTDVRYENGVFTYYIQYDEDEDQEVFINEITHDYLFFIETDAVLPEGMDIRLEFIPI